MGFVPVKSKALEGVAATLLYPMVVSSFKSKSQMCKSNERKNNQLDIELQNHIQSNLFLKKDIVG